MKQLVWEYLKQFWQAGETWVETDAGHVATLMARALHWERTAQNDVVEEAANVEGDVATAATEVATEVKADEPVVTPAQTEGG